MLHTYGLAESENGKVGLTYTIDRGGWSKNNRYINLKIQLSFSLNMKIK